MYALFDANWIADLPQRWQAEPRLAGSDFGPDFALDFAPKSAAAIPPRRHATLWLLLGWLLLALLLALLLPAPRAKAAAALPSDSLYWLSLPLQDANGQKIQLGQWRGTPLLITMFYGNCSTACPIIIEHVKRTVAELRPAAGKLHVLLVSLDPKHDNPASLQHLLKMHKLDPALFSLAVSDGDSHTRTLAATLGIKYRVLDSGEINHNTRLSILDADGVIRGSLNVNQVSPEPEFLQQIRKLM